MPDIVALADNSNTCLELLLEAHLQGNLKDGVLRLLVSPNGQTRAQAESLGLATLAPAADEPLASQMAEHCDPAIIVQTGPQTSLPPDFHLRHGRHLLAIRESLPGQFAGPDPIRQAWEAGQRGEIRWSGCHAWRPGAGGQVERVVRQVTVPVNAGDDFTRFRRRMALAQRWVLLKGIKQLLYEGRKRRLSERKRLDNRR